MATRHIFEGHRDTVRDTFDGYGRQFRHIELRKSVTSFNFLPVYLEPVPEGEPAKGVDDQLPLSEVRGLRAEEVSELVRISPVSSQPTTQRLHNTG